MKVKQSFKIHFENTVAKSNLELYKENVQEENKIKKTQNLRECFMKLNNLW